jgi:transcriptional regulator with GAF, ATPase, and Fis domain
VGECSLMNQTKLLRALQPRHKASPCERWIKSVGEEEERKVDVRVIAATHSNLLKRVREGRFRDDLYYRLAKLTIKLPPLRQRGEGDCRSLAKHNWDRINAQLRGTDPKYQPKQLAESAYQRLSSYGWPGNVREMENLLRQVAVMTPGNEIAHEEIDAAIAEMSEKPAEGLLQRVAGQILNVETQLDTILRVFIVDALQECNWVKAQAATLLDISPQNLARKIERLQIERPTGP